MCILYHLTYISATIKKNKKTSKKFCLIFQLIFLFNLINRNYLQKMTI